MKKRNGQPRRNVIRRTTSQEPALSHSVMAHTPDVLGKSRTSHHQGSTKEVEAIEKLQTVEIPHHGNLGRLYINVIQHLQTIGPIVALLAILLTYWNVNLQLGLSAFEKNQRVSEMAVNLATFWEAQLTEDTRNRVIRFITTLESFKSSPQDQEAFLSAFLDKNNSLSSASAGSNIYLLKLIDPDWSVGKTSTSVINPSLEVARYRAALTKALNTMELVAIVKLHTDLPEGQRVLETAYAGTIKQRYKQLMPFIKAYRDKFTEDRKIPAWQPLDDMVNEAKK